MDQDPLSEYECMMSVVDPKGKGENKFRYIVVTQDEELVCFVAVEVYGNRKTDMQNRERDCGRSCPHRLCTCGGVS